MNLKRELDEIDLERLLLVPVLFSLLLVNVSGAYSYLATHPLRDFTSTLQIAQRGLLVCFYLLLITLFFTRSQASATSRSVLARVLAYVGSFTPFLLVLVTSPEGGATFTSLSVLMMTSGMLFSLYSLKTLGRSFGVVPQARALVHGGPYRLIRHPLYAGKIVTLGGTILAGLTVAKAGIFLLFVAIQSYRAIEEEKVLEENIPEYSAYKAVTKRFIPWVI